LHFLQACNPAAWYACTAACRSARASRGALHSSGRGGRVGACRCSQRAPQQPRQRAHVGLHDRRVLRDRGRHLAEPPLRAVPGAAALSRAAPDAAERGRRGERAALPHIGASRAATSRPGHWPDRPAMEAGLHSKEPALPPPPDRAAAGDDLRGRAETKLSGAPRSVTAKGVRAHACPPNVPAAHLDRRMRIHGSFSHTPGPHTHRQHPPRARQAPPRMRTCTARRAASAAARVCRSAAAAAASSQGNTSSAAPAAAPAGAARPRRAASMPSARSCRAALSVGPIGVAPGPACPRGRAPQGGPPAREEVAACRAVQRGVYSQSELTVECCACACHTPCVHTCVARSAPCQLPKVSSQSVTPTSSHSQCVPWATNVKHMTRPASLLRAGMHARSLQTQLQLCRCMHGRPGACRALPASCPACGHLHSCLARRDGRARQESFRAPRARICGGQSV